MEQYSELKGEQLEQLYKELNEEYEKAKALGLQLDMSRGKPANDQIELSLGLISNMSTLADMTAQGGIIGGNYGVLNGIVEARELMSEILEIEPDNMFVGGNSSLNMMHDLISLAYVHGFANSPKPWKDEKVKFLCPSPGYDRHFTISEHFGFELVQVGMTNEGPDMDQVEELVKDPAVKGIWNVPKYSNPMGITYTDDVVRRFAALKPAAEDFKIIWDNSYVVHHLQKESPDKLLNIMAEAKKHGNEDMVFVFTSTSKMTFPGAGISAMGTSATNVAWFTKHISKQTISYDKINQIRHVKFLKNKENIANHMEHHAKLIRPKFAAVLNAFKEIESLNIASWTKPNGGYFISLDVLNGCAKRVVDLCAEAGVVMTPAGATHPYGKDPEDKTIRIAPTYPTLDEIEKAANLLCLCIKLASVELYLNKKSK